MLLRLSRFFVLLSELLSDVEQWENGLLTWRQIRALRKLPEARRCQLEIPDDQYEQLTRAPK